MTETVTQPITPGGKIYKDKAMYAVAFFGGPLAAGYIIAENFKTFGDRKKYKITWLITILVTLVLFGGLIFLPGAEKIPSYIIPIAYSAVAVGLMRQYQGKQIDEHLAMGGQSHSGWRSFLVVIIAILISIAFALGCLFLSTKNDQSVVLYYPYGQAINEIQYIPGDLSKEDVQAFCKTLSQTDFLDSTYKQVFFVDKTDGKYQLYVPFEKPLWNEAYTISYFTNLRAFLGQSYQPLEINICDASWHIQKTIR